MGKRLWFGFLVVVLAFAGVEMAGYCHWLTGGEKTHDDLWHKVAGRHYQPQPVVIGAIQEQTSGARWRFVTTPPDAQEEIRPTFAALLSGWVANEWLATVAQLPASIGFVGPPGTLAWGHPPCKVCGG